jgi:hypothetical protein
MTIDLAGMTNAELLRLSGGALAELRLRGIVRTGNAPAGDLAERLVSEATGGELAPNSEKSWDVRLPSTTPGVEGARIQVKARIVSDPRNLGQRQVSAFRSWDCEFVMFVLFDPLFRVRAASLIPVEIVRQYAKPVAWTASERVFATNALLRLGSPWAARLRAVGVWDAVRTGSNGNTLRPGP